ncbi:RHS repeat-associated core domain-containing protein [Oceanirhabdus sp. W0125-5]|uniref:RHS repeat-associated core domain-containing protein n=1 Tax=Oceanirhabdus sp. W0125-5 TaxID=2999116 RepID=UPI0022F32E29|nr:RHS repeat-associated core domain-containing protein [Oceanirhabdus sp. W0125-5]WBW98149.1 DUF4474 domain-containing protein [Oceanirhabdus sp. W0125-5]
MSYLDGNREKEIEERQGQPSRTREFKYDGLGRLETEKEQGKDPVEYDYDDSNNRSKKIAPFDLQNITNDIVEVSYKYNGLNQLTNAQIGSTTASYTYNGNGLRRSKTVNGNRVNHIWDGQNIIAETDAANNIISEYIRGINLIAVEKDNKKIFYLYNGHGDVIQLTDENGNVIKNYQYDAFGNELNIDSNDTNPFRYGGEYFDKETGLYYLRARYYDPKIGRFTTEDSYWGKDSDPLSLNLYTYCHNNPIIYVDPSGNFPSLSELLHRSDKFVNDKLESLSTFVREKTDYKNFSVDTSDIGGFFLQMDVDDDGIYHASFDCWQQYFGYNDLYDLAFDLGSSMDKAKFEFEYKGKDLIFWAWKGDYINLGAGAELGIYRRLEIMGFSTPHWLVDQSLALPMSLTLKDNGGNTIINNYKPNQNQWWITGFNPKFKDDIQASNLKAIYTVDFSGKEDMYDAFIESDDYLKNIDKWSIVKEYLLRFEF